jgi:hypothetical protein
MIVIRLQKIGNATELAIDDMETDGDIDSERWACSEDLSVYYVSQVIVMSFENRTVNSFIVRCSCLLMLSSRFECTS